MMPNPAERGRNRRNVSRTRPKFGRFRPNGRLWRGRPTSGHGWPGIGRFRWCCSRCAHTPREFVSKCSHDWFRSIWTEACQGLDCTTSLLELGVARSSFAALRQWFHAMRFGSVTHGMSHCGTTGSVECAPHESSVCVVMPCASRGCRARVGRQA